AEDGIRGRNVTGVQTCALPISPVFAWMWVRLGRHEPSVPAKIALGVLFMGMSFLVLVPAGAMAQSAPGVRVSPWWLVVAYGISRSEERRVGKECGVRL